MHLSQISCQPKINMNIKNLEETGDKPVFNGLYGLKTGMGGRLPVELTKIDKYYAFPGETLENVTNFVNALIKKGEITWPTGKHLAISNSVQIKQLPFSEDEFYKYKNKDGKRLSKKLLSNKDKEIDYYLSVFTRHGLYSLYANTYKETFSSKILKAIHSIADRLTIRPYISE